MSQTDADLLESIKQGDREAFATLMNKYEAIALNWAREVVRDHHLAEDAVQEAFIRLQNKIHSLHDPASFRPWFRQTVRRTAINMIRGTGSRLDLQAELPEYAVSLDSFAADPLQEVLHKEMKEQSSAEIFPLLPAKARSVMQALADEDSSPEEIAERLQLAKSNVYNIISRSRAKANDERFRMEMDAYLAGRRRAALPKRMKLSTPGFTRPYSLLSVCVYEALRFAGEHDWTLTDITGISGDAFRLNIAEGCHWRGISTFDWSYAMYQTVERLGWRAACFGRPGRTAVSHEQQVELLRIIHNSIDRGLPAIVWNLSINEFSLIYGYDDESRTIFCRSFRHAEAPFEYEQLGRNCEQPGIFVAALEKRVNAPASDKSVIHGIVRHVRGEEPLVPRFAFGLNGYRLWMESARSGHLDMLGHAYQVAILSESRHHAVQYLERLAVWARSKHVRSSLADAAVCYRHAEDALRLLYPSFPFGYGDGTTGSFERIAAGLQEAFEAEKEAAVRLEEAMV
ncbi:RNA polymerase sigma factor [Paenibacillus alkalitolerans]|uniref:RNA polymerase sigma factor n=1 Tax=Paenibacillus alkalitolerans TaxID=2799335 RepID=UPI0018F4592A|nr:RNA polymerase sigma factor [Paenibacillus alkalitolerans]